MLAPTERTDRVVHLRVQACAKVNLVLRVLGKRPDGYHEIRSIALGVGLCDELVIAPSPGSGVRLWCDDPALPGDGRNLVVRAARLLAERAGVAAGAAIELRKRIPVAAGLGGGSSDAAATLRALNNLWGTGFSDAELAVLGSHIGSDVPLFFALPAAVMSGRGEQVQPAALAWSGWVLLVFGGWQVSTPEVYGAWQATDSANDGADPERELLAAGDARSLMAAACNELEPAVFRICQPMGELHRRVSAKLDRPVRVSGAGSTLFTLFDDEAAARAAAASLNAMGLTTAVVSGGRSTTTNS